MKPFPSARCIIYRLCCSCTKHRIPPPWLMLYPARRFRKPSNKHTNAIELFSWRFNSHTQKLFPCPILALWTIFMELNLHGWMGFRSAMPRCEADHHSQPCGRSVVKENCFSLPHRHTTRAHQTAPNQFETYSAACTFQKKNVPFHRFLHYKKALFCKENQ